MPRSYQLSVLAAALILPVAWLATLLSLTLPTRLAAPPFVILRTVTVRLVALALSAPLLALVALALVALLSLSLTALILIVLLSHGVCLSRHRGPSDSDARSIHLPQ